MRSLSKLLLLVVAGALCYALCFAFVLRKPLTVGTVGQYLAFKENYLSSVSTKRKILIIAGSNGRFSHRCETIANLTGVTCANGSIAVGYNLPWLFGKYLPYLQPGDVVYMPLEYRSNSLAAKQVGEEGKFIVSYDHGAFWSQFHGVQRLQAIFEFSFSDIFSSLGEMGLSATGHLRRFSTETLTPQGDERGHTAEKGLIYRQMLTEVKPETIPVATYESNDAWTDVDWVVDQIRARGAIAVGGLPTSFQDVIIPDEAITFLKDFYRSRKQCFIELPNKSQYPRSDFYDTQSHLSESFQIEHSTRLAPLLGEISASGTCSS